MADEPQDPQVEPIVNDPSVTPPEPEPAPQQPDFESRFTRLEQQLASVATLLANQRQPQPVSKVDVPDDVSDADLFRLAQQGDENAYALWTQRQAGRVFDRQYQTRQYEQMIDQQLMSLGQRYTAYQDANHPLTAATRNTYQALLSRGYAPSKATLLEAMKTAIADNPGIVSEIHTKSQVQTDQPRRAAVASAQSGQTGVPRRETPRSEPSPFKVRQSSPEELALARRMGIKDPKAAKERFLQRQQGGQSSLGAVSNFVREEDL